MEIPQDFKEFCELMISANVRFVMIGGYAYNLYRNPRATGDIDFFVSNDVENEKKLREVLVAFGFGSTLPPETERLLITGKVLMLGRSPIRIDILTSIDGVEYKEAERTARTVGFAGGEVPVISPRLLL
jgi:hypothetical protein